MSIENVITEFFEDNKFLSNTQWEYTLWRGQKSSWSKSFTDIKGDNCSSLKEIYYNGTKEEWNLIEKEDEWDEETSSYQLIFKEVA